MKILVVGYQRSGTTLLRRLIGIHPDVVGIIHEKRILKSGKTKKDILKFVNKFSDKYNEKNNWGEKVPFYGNASIVTYCKKWIDIFGKESRIVHIVRHPLDVAISNVKMTRSPARSVDKAVDLYNKIYPRILENMESDEVFKNKMIVISFETLVQKPKESLTKILKFCNLKADEKTVQTIASAKKDKLRYFDGINAKRAFSYKKEGHNDSKIDYERVRKYERIIC